MRRKYRGPRTRPLPTVLTSGGRPLPSGSGGGMLPMRLAAAIALLITAWPAAAAAQFFADDNLAAVRTVAVLVQSTEREAPASCLPADEQLKAEAELVLRRAGVRVVEEDESYGAADVIAHVFRAYPAGWNAVPAEQQAEYQAAMRNRPHHLTVEVVALHHGVGLCAVSYSYRLWRIEPLVEPLEPGLGMGTGMFGLVMSFYAGGVVTGGRTQAAGQLRETTNAEVTLLANRILRARGQ